MRLMKEKEDNWLAEKARTVITDIDTVEDLCMRHLVFQMKGGELKPKSADRREGTIKNQIAKYPIGHMQVQVVSPTDIEEHINALIKKDLSVSSIEKALDVINAAYEWGVVRGDIKTNPALSIKRTIKKRLSKLEAKIHKTGHTKCVIRFLAG